MNRFWQEHTNCKSLALLIDCSLHYLLSFARTVFTSLLAFEFQYCSWFVRMLKYAHSTTVKLHMSDSCLMPSHKCQVSEACTLCISKSSCNIDIMHKSPLILLLFWVLLKLSSAGVLIVQASLLICFRMERFYRSCKRYLPCCINFD